MHLFDITPTPAQRWAIIAASVLVFVGVVAVRRRKPIGAMREFKPLLSNPARHGRKPWAIVEKRCSVVVAGVGGLGRDAHIEFDLVVLNRSKHALGRVEFAISGGSWVQEGDLDIWVEVGGQAKACAPVRCSDGHSPIIVIPMLAPGLAPEDTVTVRLWWLWPGLANARSERWILGLSQMPPGALSRIRVDYPSEWPQVAEARLLKSFGGFQWDVAKGAVTPKQTVGRMRFEFEHVAGRRDSLICIDMRAMPAAMTSTNPVSNP